MLSEQELNRFPVNRTAAVDLALFWEWIGSFEAAINEAEKNAISDEARQRIDVNKQKVKQLKSYYKAFINLIWENAKLLDIIIHDNTEMANEIKAMYDKNK